MFHQVGQRSRRRSALAKRSVVVRVRSQRLANPGLGKHLTRVLSAWFGVALVGLTVAAGLACQNRESRSVGGVAVETQTTAAATATTATASQILTAVQAQPGSPVQPAVAQGFASSSGALRPQFSASALAAESKPANGGAAAAMHGGPPPGRRGERRRGRHFVEWGTASGRADGRRLRDLSRRALASGATVLHRALPSR